MKSKLLIIFITFIFFIAGINICHAQSNVEMQKYKPVDKVLYDTIIYQDSVLFNAFNNRDFEKFRSFFDSSLEIYQDHKT